MRNLGCRRRVLLVVTHVSMFLENQLFLPLNMNWHVLMLFGYHHSSFHMMKNDFGYPDGRVFAVALPL